MYLCLGDSFYDDDDDDDDDDGDDDDYEAVGVPRAYHCRGPIKSSSAAFWYRRPLSWGGGFSA